MVLATILAPLLGTALVVAVATGPLDDSAAARNLPAQQKSAAIQPLVRSATDCIVHAVVADPRYVAKPAAEFGSELGDLIVASMPSCTAPVRTMIDAYDRYYGEGSGEAFFMGPYLDMLPNVVVGAGKKASQ
jgi:hypothetical protein